MLCINDVLLNFKYIRMHHLIWGLPEISFNSAD